MTDQQSLPNISVPSAVSIGAFATRVNRSEATIQHARAAMADGGAILLPSALEPEFLAVILDGCSRITFVEEQIDRIGWRLVERHDAIGRALRFALQRPAFLQWVESVTDCGQLHEIAGVVAETVPGTSQGLDWHDDMNGGPKRRLALTVHLSEAAFEGGHFELCDKETGRLLVRQGAVATGSITIFRIDLRHRHRVAPVTGGRSRRVFAGWLNA